MSGASEVPAIPEDVREIVERFTCEYAPHLREIVQLDMALAIAAARPVDTGREKALEGWQPIETAPMDGTMVLIWDGLGVNAARFIKPCSFEEWISHDEDYSPEDEEYERRIYDEYVEDTGEGWGILTAPGDGDEWSSSPTHWMPLPVSPALASQKKGDGRG